MLAPEATTAQGLAHFLKSSNTYAALNPHPTKSKPCKIGRKHTGAPSSREKGRRRRNALQLQKQRNGLIQKWNRKVAEFWAGERDEFPPFPNLK